MASRFGSDVLFMCACGQLFYNKGGLRSHMANTSDGNDHFPTGIYWTKTSRIRYIIS